jgi:2-keto-myo-inositol isomerase
MAIDRTRFCLNRIVNPALDLESFFKLAGELGLSAVELRNDLPGVNIIDDLAPEQARALADRYQVRILTINAIQRFNLSTVLEEVTQEVLEMIRTAGAIGCRAIVLCPNNDKADGRTADQCYQDTVAALKRIGPLFASAGIEGLVEPLGFSESSLRSKRKAVEAIGESEENVFRMVHDSFHHFIGPDESFFPLETGIVHISGVESEIDRTRLRDGHRLLIGPKDVIHNQAQIGTLERQGYRGFYSYEPFSAQVQEMDFKTLLAALDESISLIQSI